MTQNTCKKKLSKLILNRARMNETGLTKETFCAWTADDVRQKISIYLKI